MCFSTYSVYTAFVESYSAEITAWINWDGLVQSLVTGIRAGSVSVDTVVCYAAGPVPATAQSMEALQGALTSNSFVIFSEAFLSQHGMPSLLPGSLSVIRSEDPGAQTTLAPTPAPTPESQPTVAPTWNFQDGDDSPFPTGDGVGEEGEEEEEISGEDVCRAMVDAASSAAGAGEDACAVMRACGPPDHQGGTNCETCRSISADLQVAQEAGLLADADVDIFCRNTSDFLDR